MVPLLGTGVPIAGITMTGVLKSPNRVRRQSLVHLIREHYAMDFASDFARSGGGRLASAIDRRGIE